MIYRILYFSEYHRFYKNWKFVLLFSHDNILNMNKNWLKEVFHCFYSDCQVKNFICLHIRYLSKGSIYNVVSTSIWHPHDSNCVKWISIKTYFKSRSKFWKIEKHLLTYNFDTSWVYQIFYFDKNTTFFFFRNMTKSFFRNIVSLTMQIILLKIWMFLWHFDKHGGEFIKKE